MPDIAMCNPIRCTLKTKCYRFRATPEEFMQSYFTEEPYNPETKTCDYYWEHGKAAKTNK